MSKKPEPIQPLKKSSSVRTAIINFLVLAGIYLLFIFTITDKEKEAVQLINRYLQEFGLPNIHYIFAVILGVIYLLSLIGFRLRKNNSDNLLEYRPITRTLRIGRIEITIQNDTLLFTDDGSIRRIKSWKERKSNFEEVRLSCNYGGEDEEEGTYFYYHLEIAHIEKSKTVILCKEKIICTEEIVSIRNTWKNVARYLKLPAVESYFFDFLRREIQDIDKSFQDLAIENKISPDSVEDSPLPPNIILEKKEDKLEAYVHGGLLVVACHEKVTFLPSSIDMSGTVFRFDEIEHIAIICYEDTWSRYYGLIVASDSQAYIMRSFPAETTSWLGKNILAAACSGSFSHENASLFL